MVNVQAGEGRPVAVLVGPPGAGKSSVGRELGRLLGVDVVDTDQLVVQRAGKPISDVFVDDGEERFREYEREAVAEALAGHDGIVSLGGGAVMDPHTRELLAGHTVVFLDVSLRYASRRSGFDRGRPLLALNPRGRWLTLMAERRPVYEEVATLRVDTDEKSVQQVAAEVADRLADRAGEGPTA